MPNTTSSSSSNVRLIDPEAFARALLPPVIVWGALVLLGNLGGQPGVVCITPMAWLLALWSGTHYALGTSGQPARLPLLAPALLGAVLGLCLGLIFTFGIAPLSTSETDAQEIARYQRMTVFIVIGSVLVCGLLSTFTAWLTQRRLAA